MNAFVAFALLGQSQPTFPTFVAESARGRFVMRAGKQYSATTAEGRVLDSMKSFSLQAVVEDFELKLIDKRGKVLLSPSDITQAGVPSYTRAYIVAEDLAFRWVLLGLTDHIAGSDSSYLVRFDLRTRRPTWNGWKSSKHPTVLIPGKVTVATSTANRVSPGTWIRKGPILRIGVLQGNRVIPGRKVLWNGKPVYSSLQTDMSFDGRFALASGWSGREEGTFLIDLRSGTARFFDYWRAAFLK